MDGLNKWFPGWSSLGYLGGLPLYLCQCLVSLQFPFRRYLSGQDGIIQSNILTTYSILCFVLSCGFIKLGQNVLLVIDNPVGYFIGPVCLWLE